MLSNNSRVVLLTAIFALSLAGPLLAQDAADPAPDAVDPAQLALDYSGAVQANTKALTAYSWNQRSDVFMEDAEVVVILELIRYTDAGERQVTLISQNPEKPGGHGPRHKKEKKIYEGCVGAAQSIPQLLMAYTMLSSGHLVDFFSNGTMSPGTDEMAGTTKIVGANVMQKGDAVTLWVDVATLKPKGMDVKTVANDKAIEAYLDFSLLEDGTSHLSHAETLIPGDNIKIVFETFDHKK